MKVFCPWCGNVDVEPWFDNYYTHCGWYFYADEA